MGFQNRYIRDIKENENVNRRSTILPFFGFSLNRDYSTTTGSVWKADDTHKDGGYYLHGTDKHYYVEFVRSKEFPNKKLEDRFVSLLNEKYSNIWSTPYICLSTSEYFENNSSSVIGSIIMASGFLCAVPALILLFSKIYDWFWYSLLIGVGLLIVGAVIDELLRTRKRKRLTKAEKEKYRQQYLDNMVKTYGNEMGEILQKIAIDLGRDKWY